MSDLKVQGVVEMSSEGAENALNRVGSTADKMARQTAQAADKAGKAVDGIGSGAEQSAEKMTRAESRMLSSIKRVTQQMELAGKTASQKLEFQIESKGLDPAKFDGAIAKLRELERAQESAARSAAGLPAAYDDIARSLGGMVSAAAALAAVGGSLGKLVQVQREFDVLNASLVTMTGSVEQAKIAFSALQQFAAKTPFSVKEVVGAFVKLKALGLDPTERALRSFGNTASAMGKSLEQFIEAVADASTGEFERLKDFGIKASQENGKVELIFRGMTTTIKNSASEITEYLTKIGETDFAGATENRMASLDGAISNLADSWDNLFLTISKSDVGVLVLDSVKVATGAVEDLTKIVRAMAGAADENARATGAMAAVQEGIGKTFETVAVLGANVSYVLRMVGTEFGGLAAQAAAVLRGDLSGAKFIGQEMKRDAAIARAEIDKLTERILGARSAAGEAAKSLDDLAKDRTPAKPPVDKEALKAAKKEAEELAKLIDRINGKDSGLDAGYWDDLEKLYNGYKTKAIPTLQEYATLVEKLTKQQPFYIKQLKDEADAQKERTKAEADYQKALSAGSADLDKRAEQLEREVEYYGLTESEIQRTIIARLEEARAIAAANGAYPEHLAYLDREIEARKRIASASANKASLDAGKRAIEEQARAWENFTRDIERSLTDSLMRSFESGEGFGKTFVKSLQNTLKTTVLKVAVQAVVNPITGAIGEVLGVPGAGAGGGGNLLGTLNTLSNLNPTPFASGFDKLAATSWGQSALYTPAQGIESGGMVLDVLDAGSVGKFSDLGNALKGASDFLDSYGGYIGAAYNLSQGRYGAAAGAAIGQMTPLGPIGAAIGSAIGGLIDDLTSSGGAPKVDVGFGGQITPQGRNYDVSGLNFWNGSKNTEQAANTLLTDNLVAALKKINAGYAGAAFLTGHLNMKGRSSNQQLAQVANSAGQTVYHRFKEEGKGSEDFQKFVADQIPKLQLALLVDAMRSAGGEIKGIADELLNATFKQYAGDDGLINDFRELTAAIDSMDANQVAEFTDGLTTLANSLDALKTSLGQDLTGTALASMVRLSGGIQNLSAITSAYTDAVLTDTEKQEAATRQLAKQFEALNLPVANSTEELKKLVDAQDLATESGQRTALALMQLAPALKNLNSAVEQQRQQLQNQIDQLTGNTAALRSRELAALDPSNRALQQRIYALQDEAAAAQKAAAVAQERAGLQNSLDQMLGNTAAIRARELAALDPSNRAIQERIWAIEDEQAAIERNTAALDAAKSAAKTAFGRLQDAVSAEKDRLNTALSAEKEVIQARLKAQQDANRAQIDAAREAADSIRGIASSLKSALKATVIDTTAYNFARLSSARDLLGQAQATGNLKLPGLEDALQLATGDNKKFYTRFEDYAFDQAVTASVIEDLYARASSQLSTQESIVSALEAQMSSAQTIADAQIAAAEEAYRQQDDALAATLAQGQSQLNALLGIDGSVLSVADAVQALGAAISAAQSAQSAALAAAQAQTQAALQAAAQKSTAAGGVATSPSENWWEGGGWVDSSNTWHPNVENSPWYGGGGKGLDYAALTSIFGGDVPNTAVSHAYGGALSAAQWDQVRASSDPNATYQSIFNSVVGATAGGAWTAGGETGTVVKDSTGGILQVIASGYDVPTQVAIADKWGVGSGFTPTQISDAVNQAVAGGSSTYDIVAAAQNLGISSAELSASTGISQADIIAFAEANNLPRFEAGGLHSGGVRLVGERGMEIEATGPARYWSFEQTRSMLSGGSNDALVAAVARLEARLDAIEANTRAGAGHSAGVNRKLDRVIRGNTLVTEVAA